MEADLLLHKVCIDYFRAHRCWSAHNIKACLALCDVLTKEINSLIERGERSQEAPVTQLRQLVWCLKIKCIAEENHVNELFLLNEDDVQNEDQLKVINVNSRSRPDVVSRSISAHPNRNSSAWRPGTALMRSDSRRMTGILTGRQSTLSSRQSMGVSSSYRPLTTGLTATQTSFSRSTRPLLKYSTCSLVSKMIYEYLYNTQLVTNKCPDYRQCLEYINLVQSDKRKTAAKEAATGLATRPMSAVANADSNHHKALISIEDAPGDHTMSDAFWLLASGICYFHLRMNRQAEERFQAIIASNPKYLDPYAWLVKLYIRTNQANKVLQTCESGLKKSRNCILYNWLARVQSLMGDLYAANANLRESLSYFPTNVEALANVGHFTFYGDKMEQALRCFERIRQLSANQTMEVDAQYSGLASSAQLLNNLALCNFFCGFYHRVIPLLFKAFLSSPSREVASDIWYNTSFIPLSCGKYRLAMACLQLALNNDSQNQEAINNLGVLKYHYMIDDQIHCANKQELWSTPQQRPGLSGQLEDSLNNDEQQSQFDLAETYFRTTGVDLLDSSTQSEGELALNSQPEMLYNMAILKKKRGHLLASVRYCNRYLEIDPDNHHIQTMIEEISQLVLHDG